MEHRPGIDVGLYAKLKRETLSELKWSMN